MNQRQYEVGETYNIAFGDHQQPDYTWYAGKAIYLRKSSESFLTDEKSHVFKMPNSDKECTFPESSIGAKVE